MYLKVLSDQMILKLSVFVFGCGPEAADHAHVTSLGEGPLVLRRHSLVLLGVQHFCVLMLKIFTFKYNSIHWVSSPLRNGGCVLFWWPLMSHCGLRQMFSHCRVGSLDVGWCDG